jgi:hypothetical protein
MKWVLVFFMAGNPQDYKIHTAYIHDYNCQSAQTRYTQIFNQTGGGMQAECRRENQIQLRRPTSIVYYKQTIDN